tara:strand:+ start:136 stop:402 length:267 start_codon:yes stop_codon:yes gene_type:complete
MPRSDNKDIAEFQKLLREVIQKKSVSKAPLIRELQNRKRSKSKSKSSVKSVRARARSVKKGKPRRRRSSQQQAGAVRDGSHQKFPRCR